MARTRNIKPAFFKNADLASLGPWARLLYTGLWCLADRAGKLKDDPRWIKAELFPYDDPRTIQVEAILEKLKSKEFIIRYHVGNNRYILIPSWFKHQHPSPREAPSTIPNPADKAMPEHNLGHALTQPGHDQGTAQSMSSLAAIPYTALPYTFPPLAITNFSERVHEMFVRWKKPGRQTEQAIAQFIVGQLSESASFDEIEQGVMAWIIHYDSLRIPWGYGPPTLADLISSGSWKIVPIGQGTDQDGNHETPEEYHKRMGWAQR